MCGIVGYIGEKRDCAPLLIEGLKRLEYRGYDSAGLALVGHEGEIFVHKKTGHVRALEQSLPSSVPDATIGIAHTRWATHGAPSDSNAHPHVSHDGRVAVVHNGIIENASELRKKLKEEGVEFVSETDTEVLPNLIAKFYTEDLAQAVMRALRLVTGSYGIAVVATDRPSEMVVARNGSPIVLGIGDGEMFVASDPAALLSHTRQVVFLSDGEVAVLTPDSYRTTDLHAQDVEKTVDELDWDLEEMEKGDFEHFMLKEIFEQPRTIRRGLTGRANAKVGDVKLGGLNMDRADFMNVDRVVLIACGTSYYASLAASYIIEEIARIPCHVEIASEFRYRNPIVQKNTLYFAVSQSGETADTLAAVREVRRKGGRVLGIINVVGSTIARETDGGIYIRAGMETAVASTKAFTSQLLALTLFAIHAGRMHDLSLQEGRDILTALDRIPEQIESILKGTDQVRAMAQSVKDAPHVLFLGRGMNYATALEGALKLKEIAYIQSEGLAAGEMKHGPLALVTSETPVIVVCPRDRLYEKTLSNMEEVRARGGRIIAIANPDDERVRAIAETVLEVPETHALVTPFLSVIPLQMLAYEVALALGRNVDKPRNLAKSVTVE